jgi:hypothetical protein
MTQTTMDDAALLDAFEHGTLDHFPHEHHLRVVYGLVVRHGEAEALRRVSAGIQRMAAAKGKPQAFHVTRTAAWTALVASVAGECGDSAELLARHPELVRRDLLDDYYSAAVLTSDAAREAFVEPDLGAELTLRREP